MRFPARNAPSQAGAGMLGFRLSMMLIAAMLLAACRMEPLERVARTIEQITRGKVTVIRDEAFANRRSDNHHAFAADVMPDFQVVGTRDLMMRDHELIGPIYHQINQYFAVDDAKFPASCRDASTRLARRIVKLANILIDVQDGKCHYIVLLDDADGALDATRRRLMTLYEVVEATPAGGGSSSVP